jgi:hypothetical protein
MHPQPGPPRQTSPLARKIIVRIAILLALPLVAFVIFFVAALLIAPRWN